jgi:hypothetical protein
MSKIYKKRGAILTCERNTFEGCFQIFFFLEINYFEAPFRNMRGYDSVMHMHVLIFVILEYNINNMYARIKMEDRWRYSQLPSPNQTDAIHQRYQKP